MTITAPKNLFCTNSSNFRTHPCWESHEFKPKQYCKELYNISCKRNKWLVIENHSFKVVGLVSYIAHTIKGWFAASVQSDPIKVNYQLLKFLRFGQTHHFFTDSEIKLYILNLRRNFKPEQQEDSYKKTAALIEKIAASSFENSSQEIEGEITRYYHANQERLTKVPLFHQLRAPAFSPHEYIDYNKGQIHAFEERHEEAMTCFEKALRMCPTKVHFQMALAKSALGRAKQYISSNELFKAVPFLNKSIQVLINIKDETYHMEAQQLISEAYLNKFAIHVKIDRFEAAMKVIEESSQYLESFKTWPTFFAFETLTKKIASLTPSETQRGEIYLLAAKRARKDADPLVITSIIKESIKAFSQAALQTGLNRPNTIQLLNARIELLKYNLTNIEEAKINLQCCLNLYRLAKESFPDEANDKLFAHTLLKYAIDLIHICNNKQDIQNLIAFTTIHQSL